MLEGTEGMQPPLDSTMAHLAALLMLNMAGVWKAGLHAWLAVSEQSICTVCACGQAVHPWIDPLTAKKVVFVDSKNEAAAMAKNFDMHDMEACLGGKGGYTYDPAEYSKFCRLLELGPQEGSTATL